MILWGVWESWQIFSAKKPAPEVFTIEVGDKKIEEPVPKGPEGQVQGIIKEQLKEILPLEDVQKSFNLLSWSVFMFILIAAGGKIATVGTRLIVKAKT